MKVTIIIPVHNSEKYLYECIESALSQTYKNIEILCIDDDSSDSSFEIINSFQKRDNRIVYIKDSNSSYGYKINIGIKKAKGEYIAILESDDRMSLNMVEYLCKIAKKYNVDVIDSDYYQMVCYKDIEYHDVIAKYSDANTYNRLLKYSIKPNKNIIENGIWTALYRKDFIIKQNIRLNESSGASYQDTSFMFLVNRLARSVYHLKMPLYQYRVDNMDSSVKNNKKVFEITGEFEYLFNELKKRDIVDKSTWELYYTRKYNTYYWNYGRLTENDKELFLKRYIDELRVDIKSGYMNRDVLGEHLYSRTYLLLDDREGFMSIAIQNKKKSILNKIIDILKIIEDRDFIIFGTGKLGTRVLNILMQNENRIQALCDNSSKLQGSFLNGFEVLPVREAVKRFPNAVFTIFNSKHYIEMKEQLLNKGVKESNVIVFNEFE